VQKWPKQGNANADAVEQKTPTPTPTPEPVGAVATMPKNQGGRRFGSTRTLPETFLLVP